MAKAPTRVERVKQLEVLNVEGEGLIKKVNDQIEARNEEIKSIQDQILEELASCGGVYTKPLSVGSITDRTKLIAGDIIVAHGEVWASSTRNQFVEFKELKDNNDIRAYIDANRNTTDYGRGFRFIARPVKS